MRNQYEEHAPRLSASLTNVDALDTGLGTGAWERPQCRHKSAGGADLREASGMFEEGHTGTYHRGGVFDVCASYRNDMTLTTVE